MQKLLSDPPPTLRRSLSSLRKTSDSATKIAVSMRKSNAPCSYPLGTCSSALNDVEELLLWYARERWMNSTQTREAEGQFDFVSSVARIEPTAVTEKPGPSKADWKYLHQYVHKSNSNWRSWDENQHIWKAHTSCFGLYESACCDNHFHQVIRSSLMGLMSHWAKTLLLCIGIWWSSNWNTTDVLLIMVLS